MSKWLTSGTRFFVLVISFVVLCFATPVTAKKGGNRGGNPGADPTCTGLEDKTPTIAFLTSFEQTKGRDGYYYQDLYLSDSSGCNTYLVKAEAAKWLPDTKGNAGKNRFIEKVRGLRLVTLGDQGIIRGVISWYDTYREPWALEYQEFLYDKDNDIFRFVSEQGSYTSSMGYLIVEQDVRIVETDNGEYYLLAALMEKEDNKAPRRIVVVNLSNGEEQEISSGTCHFVDPYDPEQLCFGPRYGPLYWDPTGSAFYVAYEHTPETGHYLDYIFRIRSDLNGGWLTPEPIVTNVGTNPFQQDLFIAGVSLDGFISYGYINPDYSGNASPNLRGILDPDSCSPNPCTGGDGIVIEGRAGQWTAEGTMIFKENGNLHEYIDPSVSEEIRTLITGVNEYDSDL